MHKTIASGIVAAAIAIALPLAGRAQSVVSNISGSNNPCQIEAVIAGSIAIDDSTTVNSKRVVVVITNKPKHGWSIHQSNPIQSIPLAGVAIAAILAPIPAT